MNKLTESCCELDNEVFVCSNCQKQFDHTQGSWPKVTKEGKLRVVFERADADEDSYLGEFACYDCIGEMYPDAKFHDEED